MLGYIMYLIGFLALEILVNNKSFFSLSMSLKTLVFSDDPSWAAGCLLSFIAPSVEDTSYP